MQSNSKSSIAKRFRDKTVGPGGWNCPCCAPPKSWRKAWMRRVRRMMKRELDKFDNKEN